MSLAQIVVYFRTLKKLPKEKLSSDQHVGTDTVSEAEMVDSAAPDSRSGAFFSSSNSNNPDHEDDDDDSNFDDNDDDINDNNDDLDVSLPLSPSVPPNA